MHIIIIFVIIIIFIVIIFFFQCISSQSPIIYYGQEKSNNKFLKNLFISTLNNFVKKHKKSFKDKKSLEKKLEAKTHFCKKSIKPKW